MKRRSRRRSARGATGRTIASRCSSARARSGISPRTFATLRSIFEELRRAGIPLDPDETPAQGQDIWLEPAYQPIVDSRIAEAASAFIDCDMNRGGDIRAQWIWCPSPPGAGVRDILGVALPRRMPAKDVQQITARIGKALAG